MPTLLVPRASCRFRMGDIVRCVGRFHQTPKARAPPPSRTRHFVLDTTAPSAVVATLPSAPPPLLPQQAICSLPPAPSLQVVVEGRAGQALNLAGEKVPEAAVVAAVGAAADAVLPRGARDLHEWAVREVLHPAGTAGDTAGHYTFYWELGRGGLSSSDGGSGESGLPGTAEMARWAAALDTALLEVAPAYGRVRCGVVGGLHLKLVAPGAFEGIRWAGRVCACIVRGVWRFSWMCMLQSLAAGPCMLPTPAHAPSPYPAAPCSPHFPSRQLAYRAGTNAAQYKQPTVVGRREQWEVLEAAVAAAAVCS